MKNTPQAVENSPNLDNKQHPSKMDRSTDLLFLLLPLFAAVIMVFAQYKTSANAPVLASLSAGLSQDQIECNQVARKASQEANPRIPSSGMIERQNCLNEKKRAADLN